MSNEKTGPLDTHELMELSRYNGYLNDGFSIEAFTNQKLGRMAELQARYNEHGHR